MTRTINQIGPPKGHDDVVVRRARVTDSIGLTLAAAFGNEAMLPSDMLTTLDAIDRRTRY